MPGTVSPADRLAVEDVLGRYFLAVDTGDVEGVLAQFTPDAIVRYGDGTRYEGLAQLRRFALRAIGSQDARGRMHVNRTLFAERDGADILLRSYLMVPQVDEAGAAVTWAALRYTEDRFRLADTGWRITERAIFHWNEGGRKLAAGDDRGENGPSRPE